MFPFFPDSESQDPVTRQRRLIAEQEKVLLAKRSRLRARLRTGWGEAEACPARETADGGSLPLSSTATKELEKGPEEPPLSRFSGAPPRRLGRERRRDRLLLLTVTLILLALALLYRWLYHQIVKA